LKQGTPEGESWSKGGRKMSKKWFAPLGKPDFKAFAHFYTLGDHLRILEELYTTRFDRLIDLNLAIIR